MLVYLLSGNRDFFIRFFDRNTFINSHLDISFHGQFFPCKDIKFLAAIPTISIIRKTL